MIEKLVEVSESDLSLHFALLASNPEQEKQREPLKLRTKRKETKREI